MTDTSPNLGYLYRMYDAADVLLYVGITKDLDRRLRQHASSKAWWPDVARVDHERHPLVYLRRHEMKAIVDEKPRHNRPQSGPPKIGAPIAFNLPPDLLARLDADALRHGVSRAEHLRAILKEKLG